MTQTTNSYDKLYENMKQRFTISSDSSEYTIGEYMLMRAELKKTENAALPVAVQTAVAKSEVAVTTIVSYVDDKLTIKQAPIKDKTIKSFPFRASASAFFTASVACAFILSFALIGAKTLATPAPSVNEIIEQADTDVGVGYVNVDFE